MPISSRHNTVLLRATLLVSAFTVLAYRVHAQNRLETIARPGEIVQNVTSLADPSQRYAIFLPSSYSTGSRAPVMFLMDPRGRALVPLELLRPAAERLGYVLLSSYNTLSDADSAFAVNDRALGAMLADAKASLSVDPRRVYLVGFSGTAHYSWTVAPRLDGSLAGILGVGGGLPAYSFPVQRALRALFPFAYFGTAGWSDFNFDGVRYLDSSLDSTRFAHRFVPHSGDHSWPPGEVAEAALEWFHLTAMGQGLLPRDDAFLAAVRSKYLAEAAALEQAGNKADAFRRYREIIQDFKPLGGVPEAESRYEALEDDRTVRRELARRQDIFESVVKYKLDVRDFYLAYRDDDAPPTTESALKKLRIEKLKKQADSEDVEVASAAKRMLATAFVNTAFYEPRDYIEAKDYDRALGILRIADAIYPGTPRVCYQIARSEAQLGNVDAALAALDCACEPEWLTAEILENDSLLEPLRGDERFVELQSRLARGR